MSRLGRALERARAELDRLGVGWAVIGGLALAVRAEPRQTRDVDIAVAVADDQQAEALLADIDNLLRVASDADVAEAQRAIALITERGCHRDRDLRAVLAERLKAS